MNHPSFVSGAVSDTNNTIDEVLNWIPHGYKFLPDDAELIKYYLGPKIAGHPVISGRIHDIDIYKYPPQQLNDAFKREGEQHLYFFTPRNRKYPNGNRPDRAVEGFGFWKATGKDIPIHSNGIIIGSKKTLVFYYGKPRDAVKSNWIMQEFKLHKEKNVACSSKTPSCKLDDWVLCKIYKNKRAKKDQYTEELTVSMEVNAQQDQNSQASSSPMSECTLNPNSFTPSTSIPRISFDKKNYSTEIEFDADLAMFLNFEHEDLDLDIDFPKLTN